MLTTYTLQDAAQGEIQPEPEGSPDDVICADNGNVGIAIRRAQRGKRPRSPEIESAATMTDVSEMATVESSRPLKRRMRYREEDVRDESQEDVRKSVSGV